MANEESYIDKLNKIIDGLESEQLSVSNNLINLKTLYNKEKINYDILVKEIENESKKYSVLLLDNHKLTYQQNESVINKIATDQNNLRNDKITFDKKLDYFLENQKKFNEIKNKYENDYISLRVKEKESIEKQKQLDNMITMSKIQNSRLEGLIKSNEASFKKLNESIQKNINIENKLEKESKEVKTKRELFDNEYGLKLKDLERREQEIKDDKLRIESEWKIIKQAKAHLENIKQES